MVMTGKVQVQPTCTLLAGTRAFLLLYRHGYSSSQMTAADESITFTFLSSTFHTSITEYSLPIHKNSPFVGPVSTPWNPCEDRNRLGP